LLFTSAAVGRSSPAWTQVSAAESPSSQSLPLAPAWHSSEQRQAWPPTGMDIETSAGARAAQLH
jgi:hypothetical protein